MKKAIVVGLIAGIVSGIILTIFQMSGLFELFSVIPSIIPIDMSWQTTAISNMMFHGISGIIWGVLYAFFYDYIPGKGVRKGLIFGLIIWVIAPIHNAGVTAMYGAHLFAVPYAITMFFSIGITYGLLIGILYKKE